MQTSMASHKKRNLTIVIVVVIIICAAAVGGVYYVNPFKSSPHEPWLFDGAYATYSGQTMYRVPWNWTMKIQVLDFNSTGFEALEYSLIQSGTYSKSNQTTEWNDYGTATHPSGYTLSRTYSATRFLYGHAIVCTAYEFTTSDANMTIYNRNSVDFPVEVTIVMNPSTGGTLSFDLSVVQTNINGLLS